MLWLSYGYVMVILWYRFENDSILVQYRLEIGARGYQALRSSGSMDFRRVEDMRKAGSGRDYKGERTVVKARVKIDKKMTFATSHKRHFEKLKPIFFCTL